jgi:NADH-quinone oxidoreductase subunit H
MENLKLIFYLTVLPGLLFTAVAGGLLSWFDRKLSARVQWRRGPAWFQPFADLAKLMGKETIVPAAGSRIVFLLAPLAGLAGVVLASWIIWLSLLRPESGFVGDLIVVIYLLTVPAFALVAGGLVSGNPLSSLGAGREIKLLLAYELPLLLSFLVPVVRSGSLRLGGIALYQAETGAFAGSWSGFLALVAAIVCQQAKIGMSPFDIAEAETEINGGPLLEYSGPPLAAFKFTRMIMLLIMPVLLITLFWGGIAFSPPGILSGVGKVLVLVTVAVLIKNTNPRLRIDQALRFFRGPVTILAAAALVLALIGV